MNPPAPTDGMRTHAGLLLAVTLLAIWRMAAIHGNGLDLFVDEAQYVVWSRELAGGYYSKPPLLAWILAATTSVCGEGQSCVRSAATAMYALTAFCIFAAMRPLFGMRSAWAGALVYITLPLVGVYSLFISTDAPLTLMTAAATGCALQALRTNRPGWWLLLGATSGLGMLAKYSFGLLPASLAVFMIADRDARTRLCGPGPWLAALSCLVVFSPNLLWNAQHRFITFTHTAEISQLEHRSLHPAGLLQFLAGQMLAFGPVATWLLLRHARPAIGATAPDVRPALRLLVALAALPMLFFCGLALVSRANLNWPMFAFVPAAMLLGHALSTRCSTRSLAVAVGVSLSLTTLIQHFPAWSGALGLKPGYRQDPFGRLAGWQEMSRQVSAVLRQHPGSSVLVDSRTIAAELLYYVPRDAARLAVWNPSGRVMDHFRLTRDIGSRIGDSFIYVGEQADAGPFADAFEHVQMLGQIVIPTHPDHRIEYRVFRLDGFRGYAVPPVRPASPAQAAMPALADSTLATSSLPRTARSVW